MSALSLINQFPIRQYTVPAGAGGNGVQDIVLTQVVPAGFFIGSVTMTLAGAGVTSGDFNVAYDAVNISTTIIGAVGVNDIATSTFFFESNGVEDLTIAIVGSGAAWTSTASFLFLRQIA